MLLDLIIQLHLIGGMESYFFKYYMLHVLSILYLFKLSIKNNMKIEQIKRNNITTNKIPKLLYSISKINTYVQGNLKNEI